MRYPQLKKVFTHTACMDLMSVIFWMLKIEDTTSILHIFCYKNEHITITERELESKLFEKLRIVVQLFKISMNLLNTN